MLALIAVVVGVVLASARDETHSDDATPTEAERPDIAPEEAVEQAWAFYESRPYFQRPKPPTEVPAGLPDMRAETCGACHTEIYEEWKLSTHRRAWLDDAQFQAELAKSRSADNPDSDDDVGWMCVNCHTPMMNQLDRLVVGLEGGNEQDDDIGQPVYVDNPEFDETMQNEAITCATCHVRDGIVYGPFGDTDAPHPTAKDPNLLGEQNCTQCHQAQAEWPERNLGCYFTTGDEWEGSTHAQTDQTCQSCHMPEVTRKLAKGFDRPERKTRRHWFGGSLIAKHPKFKKELDPLRKVYGTGIEIELIEPDGEFDQSSTRCEPDQACRRLWVRLTNENAGHNFPTGDPERHADIDVVARSDGGEVLARAKDRIASRYEWWPDIKKLTDNRIAAGDHHDIILEVPHSEENFTVEIVGHKYRMYKDAFEHHELEGEYVRGRKFHESRWTVDEAEAPSLIEISDDWGERETLEHD
ncbi:MAG: multiheme c-type cytochrome [Persicimonas sp.]